MHNIQIEGDKKRAHFGCDCEVSMRILKKCIHFFVMHIMFAVHERKRHLSINVFFFFFNLMGKKTNNGKYS